MTWPEYLALMVHQQEQAEDTEEPSEVATRINSVDEADALFDDLVRPRRIA